MTNRYYVVINYFFWLGCLTMYFSKKLSLVYFMVLRRESNIVLSCDVKSCEFDTLNYYFEFFLMKFEISFFLLFKWFSHRCEFAFKSILKMLLLKYFGLMCHNMWCEYMVCMLVLVDDNWYMYNLFTLYMVSASYMYICYFWIGDLFYNCETELNALNFKEQVKCTKT